MRRHICLLAFFALFKVSHGTAAQPLIERGSEWRLFKGTQEPADAEHRWREAGFDDRAWPVRPAPFRYGDGAGGTLLDDMRGTYGTVYLRGTFSISDPTQFSALDLLVNFDDGFKVWINNHAVASVNAPERPGFDSVASAPHESGGFETFEIANPGSILKPGINVIAVQGFNINRTSSDFLLDIELLGFPPDHDPPLMASITPGPGKVAELREVTVRFNEAVTGVDIDDLRLNGQAAIGFKGSADTWSFSFPPATAGDTTLSWRPDHRIRDTGRPPNPFDAAEVGGTWTYQIVDDIPPKVVELVPAPGSTVRRLSRVRFFFTEPVRGFDVQDILINGTPPSSVAGFADGPWQLEFDEITDGPVHISWSSKQDITDQAPRPNRFEGGGWSYVVDADSKADAVVINEFLASNSKGLSDDDGERHDWIELKNTGLKTVHLAGWSLTDKRDRPAKWTFPSVTLEPGDHLVVFASGKNRRDRARPLHTNFKLSVDGDYLGLFSPELPRRPVDELSPRYPAQRTGYSHGRMASGKRVYFSEPTPGRENPAVGIETALRSPTFSVERGFFTKPISVSISAPDANAVIRYTLDHSEPNVTHGTVYQGPIGINETTIIRAGVFAEGALASPVVTQTYVVEPSAAVTSLPLLSLVTEARHLRGETGIMEINPRNTIRRGIAWERPVSVELLVPGSKLEGFQIDCGLRIQGGDFIRHNYRPDSGPPTGKFSFRLFFRDDYGAGRLAYPLFPGLPVEEFEHLVLRAGMNDAINPFIVDELVRRLYGDMGQASSMGTLVNLFLNGKNQGYYNPTERIDGNFLRSRHGRGSEWDLIAQLGEIREGDATEWRRFLRIVLERDLSIPDHYAAVLQQLEIDNFIDYIILNVYADMDDWPNNNWRAARERVARARWRFYVWDAERSFGSEGKSLLGTLNRLRWPQKRTVTSNNLNEGALAGSSEIARIFRSLLRNGDFRRQFADRVQKHYFGGGALTDENIARRHQELVNAVKGVLPDMSPYIATEWIPKRRAIVMDQMASLGLQNSANAPRFSHYGGRVPAGFQLSITAPEGDVYYTLDGADPHPPDTHPSPARAYGTPTTIESAVTVKARTLASGKWSALTEATFFPEPTGHPLRIVEIMYNPPGGSEYEFVEVLNTSGVKTDLGWCKFKGIDFTFGMSDSILPGERILLASAADPAAFARRYPGVQVHGWFAGSLADNGEKLTIENALGETLASVRYDDKGDWAGRADGEGSSLEIIDPLANANMPANWKSSLAPGGTPGRPRGEEIPKQ